MKTILYVIIGSMLTSGAAWAQPPEGPRMKHHEKMLEKFDADGDGVLSEEEREVAKAARKAKHERRMLTKFDEDGDGVLSDSEQAAADEAKAEYIANYDADGDGELSREEHRQARKDRMKKKRGGCCGTKGDSEAL